VSNNYWGSSGFVYLFPSGKQQATTLHLDINHKQDNSALHEMAQLTALDLAKNRIAKVSTRADNAAESAWFQAQLNREHLGSLRSGTIDHARFRENPTEDIAALSNFSQQEDLDIPATVYGK